MVKSISAGLDGSPVAESVIPYVTELAAALTAPVTLLTVIDLPQDVVGEGAGAPVEKAAHDYLKTIEPHVAKAGVTGVQRGGGRRSRS